MKNTQKKLKSKHFRYLSKDIIKNPLRYIEDYYTKQTSILSWAHEINLFVNAGAYPEMACAHVTENGFHCREMIQQIEIAYVIFIQFSIPIQTNPLHFFASKQDYYNYCSQNEYTLDGKKDPLDMIGKFFSFYSLQQWYDILDNLMMYMTNTDSNTYDKFGDKIVAIKEQLIRLAFALYYLSGEVNLSADREK